MSQELTCNFRMTVVKRDAEGRLLQNQQHGHSFFRDVSGAGGPYPGKITVPLTGVQIPMTQLAEAGPAWLKHLGLTSGADPGADHKIYYVELGIKDLATSIFYPFVEIWPGEEWPIPLTRNLLEKYNSTGTGTGPANNMLWAISHIASCDISLSAYQR